MENKNTRENQLLGLALAGFYLNDFLFLFNSSALVFYLSDYLFKGALFTGIVLILKRNGADMDYFKFPKCRTQVVILWIAVLLVIGILIDQGVWRFLNTLLPQFGWQIFYPMLTSPIHKIFDLTVGIFLVAFTEEYIFRYLIVKKLRSKISIGLTAVISLLLFGLAHWSLGLTAIFSTMLWAVLPLISVFRLKSLWPAIIVHYLTDVLAFSGLIDKILNGS